MAFLDRISWPIAGLLALTLGLAPFVPEPHVWEKLKLLAAGGLSAPIDMLDLAMHGAPWVLVLVKGLRVVAGRSEG